MSREKRDKWRDVLGEAEATHSKLLAVYEALNKENVRLQTREQLLMSMIDGMAAISNCILDHAKANMTETAPGAACMALLLSVVQERERAITHNLQLVSCLRQAGLAPDTSSSLAMARQLFEPAYVQKVLSTPTDALIDRLRLLAGQCAIRVFQEQGALEMWQDMRAAVGSQEADPVLQACVAAAAAAGGTTAAAASTRDGGTVGCHHTPITAWDRQHTQAPYIQQQQQHPGGCGSSSSTQTAAGVSNDAACRSSGSSTDMYQPAVAFVSIMFILMLFDEQRFPVFANINLDTGEVVPQVQPDFWLLVEDKLNLTEHQRAAVTYLQEMYLGGILKVSQQLLSATQQQAGSIDQLQQLRRQQSGQAHLLQPAAVAAMQHPLQVQPQAAGQTQTLQSQACRVHQLQAEQAEILKAQTGLLKKWKLMSMRLAVATLAVLTPRQVTLMIAASFPMTPRMDMVLAAIARRTQAEDQQAQQQQQEQQQEQQQQRRRRQQ